MSIKNVAVLALSLTFAFTLFLQPEVAQAEENQACLQGCVSDYNDVLATCVSDPRTGNDGGCSARAEAKKNECNTSCGQSPNPTGAAGSNTQVRLLNPIGLTDPRLIVGRIIKGVLSIIGTITLAMFTYGGVLWLTSMGESDKVEKGKKIFVWTTLGLAIIAGAYTAVTAIMKALSTGSITGA